MSDDRIPRRTVLKSALLALAANPAVAMLGVAEAGTPPALVPLTVSDAQAKALGYAVDTTKVDVKLNPTHKATQKCATCVQYQGKANETQAGCNLFPGKSVTAAGWCKVWAQKPS